MNRRQFLTASAVLLTICGFSARSARAGEMDHETIVTFDNAVRIPGRVLAPGTYDFKRLDLNNANVLQIFDDRNMHLVATVRAQPDQLADTPSEAIVTLSESVKGSPAKLLSWTYPGDNTAENFVYPQAGRQNLKATKSIVGTPKS